MNLTAITPNGVRTITDKFEVRSYVDFDVARDGATRIYPPVRYVMNFTIKANKDYSGPIREYVPSSFAITPQEGLTITTINDAKILTWNKNLIGGETYNIYYEFDAPDISPEFYILGSLEIGSFAEIRQWQIANDAPAKIAWTINATGTNPTAGSSFQIQIDGISNNGANAGTMDLLHDAAAGGCNPATAMLASCGATIRQGTADGWSSPSGTCGTCALSDYNTMSYSCASGGTCRIYADVYACDNSQGTYEVGTLTSATTGGATDDCINTLVIDAAPLPNVPPLVSAIINSTPANLNLTNSTLWCYNTSQSDSEGDAVTVTWNWYKDAVITGDTTQSIDPSLTLKNEQWICQVNAYDGTDYNRTNSTTLTILNAAPFINATVPAIDANTGVAFTAPAVNCTDVDGDTITYYVNDTRISVNSGTGELSDTPTEDETGAWTINASCGDGTSYGWQNFVYTVNDTVPPKWYNFQNNASTITLIDGFVNWSVNLTDGAGLSSYIFGSNATGTWITYAPATISGMSVNVSVVNQTTLAKGKYVCANLTFNDTNNNWNTTNLSCFTVDNSAPTAIAYLNATDYPLNRTNANLTCWNTSQSDADGDEATATYAWYNDSYKTDITNNIVHSDNTTKGQNWTCELSVTDGAAALTINSANLTIENSLPSQGIPIINSTPANQNLTNSTLWCFNTSQSDADNDAITISYVWYKDSVIQASLTSQSVAPSDTLKTEAWLCEINITDGEAYNRTNSTTLTILNAAPFINATVPNIDANTGVAFTAPAVNCTDADGDTITYYVNDTRISVNSGTGELSDTPTEDETGAWVINASCGDGALFGWQNFVYTVNDTVPPKWYNFQNNASTITLIDGFVNWSVNFTDGVGLSSYIFGSNATGTWITYAPATISGMSVNVSVVNQTTDTYDYVCANLTFNDTNNNWNTTNLSCFTMVTNTPPLVSAIINSTPANLNLTTSTLWCYNTSQSDANNDAVTITYNWYNSSDDVTYELMTDYTGDNLTSTNTTKGQYFKCQVNADDGTAANSTNSTSLEILNSAPDVFYVNWTQQGDLAEAGRTAISFTFNVSDADGYELNYTRIAANISLGGDDGLQFFNGTGCNYTNYNSIYTYINCTVLFDYWANASANWVINISVADNSSAAAFNDTMRFTINTLTAMRLEGKASINFTSGVFTGLNDIAADAPLIINNTGNFDFSKINITGQNLTGMSNGEIIYPGNITVNVSDSASGISIEAGRSVILDTAGANLTHGAPGIGNLSLYFYVDVPTGLTAQVFNVTYPWEIIME